MISWDKLVVMKILSYTEANSIDIEEAERLELATNIYMGN